VVDDLALEQGAHDVHALLQPGVAFCLVGPRVTRDVLVGELTAADCHPEAIGEHLGECRCSLGDDGGVIALARRVHDAEWELGRL
jgi:hypothetical protein